MIQAIISRMASNSFLVKGWSVTLAGAIMAFSAAVNSGWSMLVAILTATGFFWLDAFYLGQERLYRCLSDEVRQNWPDNHCLVGDIDLSLRSVESQAALVFFSPTLFLFHLPIVVTVVVVATVLFI
jgi:hypothetical protein